jgi:LysM repeat protein
MRPLPISILAAAVALLVAPAANAHVEHTVAPGETLWSIAAQSN